MKRARIRHYEERDRKACRLLWAELVQRHREIYEDPTIGGDDPGMEFDEHLSRVGPQRTFVAVWRGKVVGLASLIASGPEGEVEPVIVSSKHRGHGIGEDLLEHATQEATTLGVLCLSVKPVARNDEAMSFFYRAGFRALGRIEMFRWLGETSPCAWKRGLRFRGKSFEY